MSGVKDLVHTEKTADSESGREDAPSVPAPRLQLRWEKSEIASRMAMDGEQTWACHYELVLPLGEYDIRREIWKDGEEVGSRTELIVPIKGPTLSTSGDWVPCTSPDGSHYYDAPYRDGSHAKWDAAVLGGLPIYAVAPDGTYLPRPPASDGASSRHTETADDASGMNNNPSQGPSQ